MMMDRVFAPHWDDEKFWVDLAVAFVGDDNPIIADFWEVSEAVVDQGYATDDQKREFIRLSLIE